MVKILSIGNSFSEDAQAYLHQIAAQEGIELRCVNLYIGGCSLQMHWENFQTKEPLYQFQENGRLSTKYRSLPRALAAEQWDYVTLQQASALSVDFDTYMPYLTLLAEKVRELAPTAKLLIHQTWAYEIDSQRLADVGYLDPRRMLADIQGAYRKAAEAIDAYGVIPGGETMMGILDAGVDRIHRDTFHATLGLGRYLLGLTWFFTLFGDRPISGFIPLQKAAREEDLRLAVKIARRVAADYRL